MISHAGEGEHVKQEPVWRALIGPGPARRRVYCGRDRISSSHRGGSIWSSIVSRPFSIVGLSKITRCLSRLSRRRRPRRPCICRRSSTRTRPDRPLVSDQLCTVTGRQLFGTLKGRGSTAHTSSQGPWGPQGAAATRIDEGHAAKAAASRMDHFIVSKLKVVENVGAC